jgi:hypothetical protein
LTLLTLPVDTDGEEAAIAVLANMAATANATATIRNDRLIVTSSRRGSSYLVNTSRRPGVALPR